MEVIDTLSLPTPLLAVLERVRSRHPHFNHEVRVSGRRKTVGLALRYPHLTVSIPPDFPLVQLEDVLKKKIPWILSQLELGQNHQLTHPSQMVSGQTLPYLGRHLRLSVRFSEGRTQLEQRGYVLSVHSLDAESCRAALVAWYRARARETLLERVTYFSHRLGLAPPTLHVRDQKTRWGSCSRSGELRFNWRIIMAPMPLLDYVVVHELCHLKVPHHGPAFWETLECILPDFKRRKVQLETLGSRLYL